MRSDTRRAIEEREYREWAKSRARKEQVSRGLDGEGPKGSIDVYIDQEEFMDLLNKGVKDGNLG